MSAVTKSARVGRCCGRWLRDFYSTRRRLAETPLKQREFPPSVTSGIERRLAAIPLPETTLNTCPPIAEAVPEPPVVSGTALPLVGASAVFCLVGSILCYARQLKKRVGTLLAPRPTSEEDRDADRV